jgi:hypothetical protein
MRHSPPPIKLIGAVMITPAQSGYFKRFLCGMLGGTSLVMALATAPPSLAGYTPPPDAGTPHSGTTTSGGRNCGVSENGLRLTLIAPEQHVGQTTESHPTFSWYVPIADSLPGEFQIYELTGEGRFQRLLEAPYQFDSTQGFMSYTLPDTVEALQPNTVYLWQVLLRCGDRPADTYKVRAQIQVVDSSRLPNPLAAEAVEQADQLAEAGLWYDAFALVANSSISATAQALRSELLEDLAAVEAEAGDTPHSDALQQIADK